MAAGKWGNQKARRAIASGGCGGAAPMSVCGQSTALQLCSPSHAAQCSEYPQLLCSLHSLPCMGGRIENIKHNVDVLLLLRVLMAAVEVEAAPSCWDRPRLCCTRVFLADFDTWCIHWQQHRFNSSEATACRSTESFCMQRPSYTNTPARSQPAYPSYCFYKQTHCSPLM